MTEKNTKNKNLVPRPPIVVVMGHIDHGKSTLLDYIRKTATTEKEVGGITQHLSAYEAVCEVAGENRKITFLDTPGHEAFFSIRERGSKVADIALLIISAEDGLKPQTIEALNYIRKENMPYIVVLNKIDKPSANVDKVKQSLAEQEVLVEGWGGTVPVVAISAKKGDGVSDLLEIIALQADVLELVGDVAVKASGFVIESNMNPQQGVSGTLIIKNGTLKKGDYAACEGSFVPIRAIQNFAGVQVETATFSSPIKLLGWSEVPRVGSQFQTFASKQEALLFAEKKELAPEEVTQIENNEGTFFPIVLKADTVSSLEAIVYELQKLSGLKIRVKIVSKGIGQINETDVRSALTSKARLIGFNVETQKNAGSLALRENLSIKMYTLIYDLVDAMKKEVEEATPQETVETILGLAKILRVFSTNKDKQVVGARVENGIIKSGGVVKIFRREAQIGEGKIRELQIQKIKATEINEGQEFGMMIESKIELVPSDTIQSVALVRQ